MKKTGIGIVAVVLVVAQVALLAQGFVSGGEGVRFNAGGWIVFGTAAPGSDARATAAPYGSFYCRQNTTSSVCYVKTSTVGGTTWTQLDTAGGSVTFAASDRVLCRDTAGAGASEECTASAVLDMIGSTRGQILYRGASGWAVLSPGTATHVLQTGGAGADPSWTAAASGTVTASSTDTFTNKTLDAEGTGNSVTIPFTYTFVVAICQNATASLGLSTPTSNPAVAACVTGANTQFAVAQFADAADLSLHGHFSLAADWTGAIDVKGKWRTSATSGDVVWQVQTACVADAETADPSFNTASTTTDTAKGTTLQLNDLTLTGITTTGCAAGEELYFKIRRDAAHASDSLAATAELVSLVFTIRRAL